MKKFVFVFLLFLVNWTFAKIVFDFTGKVVKVDDGDTIWVETSNLDYKIRIL
jgi:endonuclease YncB( thermonuclease family)